MYKKAALQHALVTLAIYEAQEASAYSWRCYIVMRLLNLSV